MDKNFRDLLRILERNHMLSVFRKLGSVQIWILLLKGIRRDRREGRGGGCVIFVKQGVQYRVVGEGTQLEYIVVETWTKTGSIKVVNFYNPCKRLSLEVMEELGGHLGGKVIWCGDFNAHSSLWGGYNDQNGAVIEELMEVKNLVCLNDGSSTRVNSRDGTESSIDLTLVSDSLFMAGS